MSGDGSVGHQHTLFDEAVGKQSFADDYIDRFSVLVQHKFRLRSLEVNGPLSEPVFEQYLCQFLCRFKLWFQTVIFAIQNLLILLIGEALGGVDHRFLNTVVHGLSRWSTLSTTIVC